MIDASNLIHAASIATPLINIAEDHPPLAAYAEDASTVPKPVRERR